MKRYIEDWEGSFLLNGEEVDNLKEWNPKKHDEIDITLLPRKEIKSGRRNIQQ